MGKEEEALSYYQKYASKSLLKKKNKVTIKGLRRIANYYGYHKNDWNKARTFAKKAWTMAKLEDGNDYINALITYMTCNYYLNDIYYSCVPTGYDPNMATNTLQCAAKSKE